MAYKYTQYGQAMTPVGSEVIMKIGVLAKKLLLTLVQCVSFVILILYRLFCALERYIPPQSLAERTHDRRYPLQDPQATPSHELALRRLGPLFLEPAHCRAANH